MPNTDFVDFHQRLLADRKSYCVGRILEIGSDGAAVVDYRDNELGPMRARSAVVVSAEEAGDILGKQVLLVFEDGEMARPIIVGFVRDHILSPSKESPAEFGTMHSEIRFDFERSSMRIENDEEILLVCGKSSIKLRADGKVIIKGTEIVSRSSGANKIKGASVNIN
jgi:hypothetical protein